MQLNKQKLHEIIDLCLEKNVSFVAVTKYLDAKEEIEELLLEGVSIIGESRLQESIEKEVEALKCEKHFIGRLQTNKIKKIVRIFEVIESLDSEKHAAEINKISEEQNKITKVFIQINIAKEESKNGIKPENMKEFYTKIRELKNINIEGIMIMPPFDTPEDKARQYMRKAKQIQKDLNLKHLSMGTSHDYKIAVEEGSTMVRIGRTLYK